MRTWNLAAGDPLQLTLAADPRLGRADYAADIIWELALGRGEPPALAAQTTLGLRAGRVMFFPLYTRLGKSRLDPAAFHHPPRISRLLPNYAALHFSPFEGIDVQAEYWVPESGVLVGRVRTANKSILPHNLRLEWAGLLTPLEGGEGMGLVQMGLGSVLQGSSGGLSVVCFAAGSPQHGKGPYPALSFHMELYPGNAHTLTWSAAVSPDATAAFDLARTAVVRPFDAETARIELVNAAGQVEIITGEPEWDAALMLAQKSALGLFLGASDALPQPSFVLTRRTDQGASTRGGGDYGYLWGGQTALDAYYLSHILLPGGAEPLKGLLDNFLAAQAENGAIDMKPGLAGQRTRLLAQPVLASLAARLAPWLDDPAWAARVYPGLASFFKAWFGPEVDRDGDGMPEWQHPLQTGLESSPLFDRWNPSAQGVDIGFIESPALASMLYRECRSLQQLARLAGREEDLPALEEQAARLRAAVEETWDRPVRSYRYRDLATHACLPGKTFFEASGPGEFNLRVKKLKGPQRLVLHVQVAGQSTLPVVARVFGQNAEEKEIDEEFGPRSFTWSGGHGVATSQQVFFRVTRLEIDGLGDDDRAALHAADMTQLDISLLLPLWAGLASAAQVEHLLQSWFGDRLEPFGLASCPPDDRPPAPPEMACVALPWNALVVEGLLAADRRSEAARLITGWMQAAVQTLKQERGFRQFYRGADGQGLGERDHLWGIPPVGLLLAAAGLEKFTPQEAILRGFNPFPWPITVQWRRVRITLERTRSVVQLPGRPPLILEGPAARRVSLT